MKIAVVSLTMNDYHVVNQWLDFYFIYKDIIYKHIIVHNTANSDYKELIANKFSDSIIIVRETNGGTTGAYNTGIKESLNDPEVDAIMLLANDCKITTQSIEEMYKLLFSSKRIGAVAPILLDRDEETIVAHGENLTKNTGLFRLYHNSKLGYELPEIIECQCLPGGMNLVKREVYEHVGLQDESLFMYHDENEFFLRVGTAGYRILSTSKALSSHCHIYTEGTKNDNSLAWFYINRNHLLVCRQYKSISITWRLFLKKFFYSGVKYSIIFLLDRTPKKIFYYYLGLLEGIKGRRVNFVKKGNG
jgi:hypothetical protein